MDGRRAAPFAAATGTAPAIFFPQVRGPPPPGPPPAGRRSFPETLLLHVPTQSRSASAFPRPHKQSRHRAYAHETKRSFHSHSSLVTSLLHSSFTVSSCDHVRPSPSQATSAVTRLLPLPFPAASTYKFSTPPQKGYKYCRNPAAAASVSLAR